ncbi:MAG: ornithine cyclodeaminase [Proteobacteria bacterium]|nr:ornithine cyclodeaminase [Pseudomonadota bacterium]
MRRSRPGPCLRWSPRACGCWSTRTGGTAPTARPDSPVAGSLDIVGIERLRPLLDRRRVLAAVRDALVWQSQGLVQSPLPGQLQFREPPGDCHIKFGHVAGADTFAVKIATGFYENAARGLPSNHGLVLVFDARTGAPRVLLQDEGWLTAWRTAAATALAAQVLAPATGAIGVVGTGLQASLALEWLPETLGDRPCLVWGRDAGRAVALAAAASRAGRAVVAVASLEELLERSGVVVTATPSSAPLFPAGSVRPGTHLVALGADSPGKQELPTDLFAGAAHVLVDDLAQALDHGDFGAAVRAGSVAAERAVPLGAVLSGRVRLQRARDDISIVDLTGIAAEDIAIAALFCQLLDGPA